MGFFDGLPSGWASAKDAKGVTYYYNRETGENTYTKPSKGGKPVVKQALQLTDGSNPPPGGPPHLAVGDRRRLADRRARCRRAG